ncbi:MAG: ABC1 kinase family protein [Acidimicrobiales bacterium]
MRRWRVVLFVATALGTVVAVVRRKPGATLMPTGVIRRSTTMAGLGARVGTAAALTRAQQVFASAERRAELDERLQMRTAEQVAATLGNMKGAMMKLGQMASYLDDGLPEPLRLALQDLQQDAPPMSGDLAAGVVAEELGDQPERVFAEWDPVPIAAASIGQVHRAMTHDGRAVAVKVQYPGVAEAVRSDLETSDLITQAVRLVYPNFDTKAMANEIRDRLTEELDYTIEADNQRLFAKYWDGHPTIHIPRVLPELSTRRVLTTELVIGARFDELATWDQAARDRTAETIFRFVFGSLYRLHAFNGDPHPGNYIFHDGGRVTFLDFGLVKRFTPAEVRLFEDLIQGMVLDRDPAALRSTLEDGNIIVRDAPVDDAALYEYLSHFYDLVLHDRDQAWTPEYASETVRQIFDRGSAVAPYATGGGSAFVIIQRINLGLYALFGRLHATANWHRIACEIWPTVDGPPSTEMGKAEADWRLAR